MRSAIVADAPEGHPANRRSATAHAGLILTRRAGGRLGVILLLLGVALWVALAWSDKESCMSRLCEPSQHCQRSAVDRRQPQTQVMTHTDRSIAAAKGSNQDRRARQSTLIRDWLPWARSTAPKTVAGKAVSSRNACKATCGSAGDRSGPARPIGVNGVLDTPVGRSKSS